MLRGSSGEQGIAVYCFSRSSEEPGNQAKLTWLFSIRLGCGEQNLLTQLTPTISESQALSQSRSWGH